MINSGADERFAVKASWLMTAGRVEDAVRTAEGFEIQMNALMAPIYSQLRIYSDPLPAELRQVLRAGLELHDGCLLRPGWNKRIRFDLDHEDRWRREWITNQVLLDSSRDPGDPLWRPQLLSWGIALASGLLKRAVAPDGGAGVQALICLQSPPVDPETDFADGSMYVYRVRNPERDDRSLRLSRHPEVRTDRVVPQPCLTVSVRN